MRVLCLAVGLTPSMISLLPRRLIYSCRFPHMNPAKINLSLFGRCEMGNTKELSDQMGAD